MSNLALILDSFSAQFPALKRADSSASSTKRKVSSISVSDTSDHEQGEPSPGPEDSPKPPPQEDPMAVEMAKFDLPDEEDQLEQNMPWLKVISKLSNSFQLLLHSPGLLPLQLLPSSNESNQTDNGGCKTRKTPPFSKFLQKRSLENAKNFSYVQNPKGICFLALCVCVSKKRCRKESGSSESFLKVDEIARHVGKIIPLRKLEKFFSSQ